MSRMEQGEIGDSPDVVVLDDDESADASEDDSHRSRQASPVRHDDNDEELGPDIKPPQAKSKHKEKHKHSKRRHSEKRRHHDDKSRSSGGSGSEKTGGQGKHSQAYVRSGSSRQKEEHNRQSDRERSRKEDRKGRDSDHSRGYQRDARDDIEDNERRKRSMQERERLERMEKERLRIERERQRHQARLENREKIERAEREWERQRRAQRQRAKEEPEYARATRYEVDQRRERDKAPSNRPPRSRSPQSRHHEEETRRSHSDHYREEDHHTDEREYRSSGTSRRRSDNAQDQESCDDYSDRHRPSSAPSELHEDDANNGGDEEYAQKEHHSGGDDERDESEKPERESGGRRQRSREEGYSSSGGEGSGSERSRSGSSDREDTGNERHPANMKSKFESASEDEESSGAESATREVDDRREAVLSGSESDREDAADYIEQTPPESPVELLPDLPPYFPAIQGCRNVEEFSCLNRIEEGTYGVVYRARDKKTDEVVALKRLKMEKEKEGFPITSLREINTLLKAQHINIVTVREIVVGSNMDRIYIVMDYVEHDLKSLMEIMKEDFLIGEVKTLMQQLLAGVAHLHDNWIIHRDLKTSNLLFSHKGILKIGDFGLAREYGSPLKQYTPIVVTLWYRAPELLLACKKYSTAIDMWSVGCIMAELITRKALFPGKSEIDQLNKIFKDLGTPNEKIWPGLSELKGWQSATFADYPYNQLRNRLGASCSEKSFDIMNRFLTYDPTRRITAEEAKKHDWFLETPYPVEPSMFPTWPAKSEQSRRASTAGNSPKPPSGGKAYSKLLGDDDEGGFHLGMQARGAQGPGFALKF